MRWVKGEGFPVIVSAEGCIADGMIVEVDDDTRARLDYYEVGFGYRVDTRQIHTDDQEIEAAVYVTDTEWPLGAPWSLTEWQDQHGPLTRLAATEYMRLMAAFEPEAAADRFPQVRSRAASRLRAMAAPSPAEFEPDMTHTTIVPERTEQPYTDFFAVQEDWLSFPKFDGSKGSVVKRASFIGGDAVTVLPFDPRTNTVMLVRQFRHGPFCRNDSNPWTLEPAAGRIDPGETPEEAAKRELFEETGVVPEALHFVGQYYPSPGAYSEFLYSYIAVADLDGTDGGVGGVADEGEDIMRHVLPLAKALEMIESGAANTGPLILSLQWLKLHHDRLS